MFLSKILSRALLFLRRLRFVARFVDVRPILISFEPNLSVTCVLELSFEALAEPKISRLIGVNFLAGSLFGVSPSLVAAAEFAVFLLFSWMG